MSSRISIISVASLLAFLVWQAYDSSAPRQEPDRLDQLEARVAELEKILFMTSSMTVFEAERRLEEARVHLRDSKALLMQGHLTQIQYQLEEMLVRQLERELDFARSPAGQPLAIGELELLAAERRLVQAQYQLGNLELIAGRGYGSDTQVARAREDLEFAKKNLDAAKAKLEATKKLQAIEKPDR